MRARSADAELVVRRAVWRRRRDGRRRAAVIAKMMAVLARLPAASARRVRAAPAARIVQVEARAAVSVNFAPDEIKQNPRQNVRATPREGGRCYRIWRTSRPGSSVAAKAKSGRTAGEAQGRGGSRGGFGGG